MVKIKKKEKKIILVYDECHIVNLVKLSLDDKEYKVLGCYSQKEVFHYLKNFKYKVEGIVVEPSFNNNGYNIIKKIKSIHNKIPILILSIRSQITDKLEAIEYGSDDYMCKPFDPVELARRVKMLREL